jgi:hypothetical protein
MLRCDRRTLLGAGLAAGAALVLGRGTARAASPLRLVWLHGERGLQLATERGVTLGAEEASRLATLLGVEATVFPVHRGAEDTGRALRDLGAFGALASGPGARGDGLACVRVDREDASDAAFRVASTRAARERALRSYQESGREATGASAVDWHPALSRFGAEQLNQRFLARFGVPMDEASWAAWFAVKILFETAFRSGSHPGAVAAALAATAFDGHKGIQLRFAADRTLSQPIYVVNGRSAPFEVAP